MNESHIIYNVYYQLLSSYYRPRTCTNPAPAQAGIFGWDKQRKQLGFVFIGAENPERGELRHETISSKFALLGVTSSSGVLVRDHSPQMPLASAAVSHFWSVPGN